MKYLVMWEFDPKAWKKEIEEGRRRVGEPRVKLSDAERKERAQHLKTLFPPHFLIGENKGFTVIECDQAELIAERWLSHLPHFKSRYAPILSGPETRAMAEKVIK
jgi:hypothetical protein